MADSQPELPEAHHADLESMLSRKFGKEVANYFSGSPLNRVSFLRTDHVFLSQAFKHPSASFLLFNELSPLVRSSAELAFVRLADIQPLVGPDPYSKPEAELIRDYNSAAPTPQLIFLGLDGRWRKEGEDKSGFVYKDVYKGAPFFALDVTPAEGGGESVVALRSKAEDLIKKFEGEDLRFEGGRHILSFPALDAAIYAAARHTMDWNKRNPFCAACGYPTLSTNGGFKRTCPPADQNPAAKPLPPGGTLTTSTIEPPTNRPPCPTRNAISNVSFPRTDPTIIVAVVSADGRRLLLGRQARWPPRWYSTLAGFIEPGESVEEAVRREVWEESGIHLGRVVVHSTQPWPYPASLMIGCVAQAVPGEDGEKIDMGHDAELEDAKWWAAEEVREALNVGSAGLGEEPGKDYKGGLRVPPRTAIAHQLMLAVVERGFVGGGVPKV
ncbi:NADH pyrophosphatase [Lineolata rhizophorae]|uniref:NAD(+) diphosphatase n=1 Tax=Lineolata rhizophorae TaxID=578093 RepID=A0A6A6NW63_9PEZI|nr:NADH pyrophosphatase [Lineolata rhizophorae]